MQGLAGLAARNAQWLDIVSIFVTALAAGAASFVAPPSPWRRVYATAAVALAAVGFLRLNILIDLNGWQKFEIFAVVAGAIMLAASHWALFRETDRSHDDAVSLGLSLGSMLVAVTLLVAVLYHRWWDSGPSLYDELARIAPAGGARIVGKAEFFERVQDLLLHGLVQLAFLFLWPRFGGLLLLLLFVLLLLIFLLFFLIRGLLLILLLLVLLLLVFLIFLVLVLLRLLLLFLILILILVLLILILLLVLLLLFQLAQGDFQVSFCLYILGTVFQIVHVLFHGVLGAIGFQLQIAHVEPGAALGLLMIGTRGSLEELARLFHIAQGHVGVADVVGQGAILGILTVKIQIGLQRFLIAFLFE